MKIIDIKKYLPHKAPILMTDYLEDIGADYAISVFNIKDDNIFCKDGTFQEVGLIENMAQTCSTITGQLFDYKEDDNGNRSQVIGFISEIKSLKICNFPKTGSVLRTKAQLISSFRTEIFRMSKINVKVQVDDTICAEAVMNIILHE